MFTRRELPSEQELLNFARQYPELDIESVFTCLSFLKTTTEIYEAIDTHMGRYELSIGKFTVLMLLHKAGSLGLTPSECAQQAGVTRGTITGLLDGLERQGLVKRQPHPDDRRMLMVQLTPNGWQFLKQMLPDHFNRVTGLMAHLTGAEKKTFVKLLAKLRAGTPAMHSAEFKLNQ